MNGVIEIATGDLLRAGYCDFDDDAFLPILQSIRTDVPEVPQRRGDPFLTTMHRWDGSAWINVAQP